MNVVDMPGLHRRQEAMVHTVVKKLRRDTFIMRLLPGFAEMLCRGKFILREDKFGGGGNEY